MRALLFDMDGTLVDSSLGVEGVWSQWAGERGQDEARLQELRHGRRTADVVAPLLPELDARAEADAIETRMLAIPGEPIDGVLELYRATPPERRAIVTSATPAMATGRLAERGVELPDVLVTANDVAVGKPDPAPYLLAAQRLGAVPEHCLVIEDAPAGIEAGLAAGMKVLAVVTTHTADELVAADMVVEPAGVVAAARELGW